MIGLIFLKKLVPIKQMLKRSVIFVNIGTLLDNHFNYEPCVCNGYHDLMQKALTFNDVAIISVKGSDYRIHF